MTARPGQIVALGGGGFSMEPENPLLDNFVLDLANKPRPRVCFIGTASGDSQGYQDRFYEAFRAKPCDPFHLSLFKDIPTSIHDYVMSMDVIYVGGGNTRNLMLLWNTWGLSDAIKSAYQAGKVLAGISAGAICWFEQGLTDSFPGRLESLDCLGILLGSACPHYDGETTRRPAYQSKVASGTMLPGLAIDDSAAAHFVDGVLKEVVASQPGKNAYSVRAGADGPREQMISSRYLGT